MAGKHKSYEQFGPYILFKKLESDSLGDLWRAARIEGKALGATVALRRMTGGNREAIVSSISIARQVAPLLTGPSFVRNQAIDVISGVPFIAHDYAGGRSLRYIVERARGGNGVPPNPIPIDQAIVIAERVALSLATISELRFAGEKLSHGALLPHFVWISDDGEIRVAGQQLGKGIIDSLKDPKQGGDLGRYFSSEYQHSHEPTKSTEVYSLGAILYLVVTGHEPPDPTSTSAFAAAIRATKTMAGAPIPDDIRPILDKSLNLDPSARYATVADMKQALSALTNSGKYSATTFNLAFFLSNLLKKEFEGEALEREKESKVNVAPYAEALSDPKAMAAVPQFEGLKADKPKSKLPLAIAAVLGLIVVGAGAFLTLGSKSKATAAQPAKLASAVPAPVRPREIDPDPIVAAPAGQTASTPAPAVAGATGMADQQAQKKAFENAVKQKLHDEMMKLQTDYTKQLQQQQGKNAPVPVPVPPPPATVADARTRATEDHTNEPSAAQLDMQRQRETTRTDTVAQQIPAPSTQAPAPVVQQQPIAAAVSQIHEGDVVDVTQVDVLPKRTQNPRLVYPPMALRQKVESTVLTSILISETGDVLDVKVLRGDDRFGFTEAAVRAVRTAKYSPAMKDGKRVKTWLPQMIQFKP
ncbi:MAG: TonB family protein [Thermoanaerobaculia bacterium]